MIFQYKKPKILTATKKFFTMEQNNVNSKKIATLAFLATL